jgi:aryl carrier-like protein
MVPAAYVKLESFPLTPNGKLDRKALPEPEGDAYAGRSYEPPQGEVEEKLAQIWEQLLKVEQVGRNDNFFELGGHSLLAIALIERLREQGLHTDVRTLFETPTLSALAGALKQQESVAVPPNLIPAGCEQITPQMLPLIDLSQKEIEAIEGTVEGGAANIQDIYPLAPLQEGILFHHLMGGQRDAYLLSSLLAFDKQERLQRFLEVLQAVVERHDILRTAVVWQGLEQPVQVVWRHAPVEVEQVQLDPAGAEAAEQIQERFAGGHNRMDITHAPLLRAIIAHDQARDRWLLLLVHHHLVMDHTTLEVLGDEIQAYIQGRAKEIREPEPFREFVAQARLGVSAAEHETFFR